MASEDLRSAVEDKALRLRELFEVVGFPVSFMFLGGRSSGGLWKLYIKTPLVGDLGITPACRAMQRLLDAVGQGVSPIDEVVFLISNLDKAETSAWSVRFGEPGRTQLYGTTFVGLPLRGVLLVSRSEYSPAEARQAIRAFQGYLRDIEQTGENRFA